MIHDSQAPAHAPVPVVARSVPTSRVCPCARGGAGREGLVPFCDVGWLAVGLVCTWTFKEVLTFGAGRCMIYAVRFVAVLGERESRGSRSHMKHGTFSVVVIIIIIVSLCHQRQRYVEVSQHFTIMILVIVHP